MKKMLKRNLQAAHPGEILREMFIKKHKLTITEVATGLGVTRVNLVVMVNERAGISPKQAIKLCEAFGSIAQFMPSFLFSGAQKVNPI